jgi:hypothetical protein
MATLAALQDTDVITIEAWHDPVVDRLGHDPRSLYVETFWLPVLGPSATWLLRRWASCLESAPDGCAMSVPEMSRALGLGERAGRNGPFMRTIARTVDFEMARVAGARALGVRTKLPPLARRHVTRLPSSLQLEHDLLERISVERRRVDQVSAEPSQAAALDDPSRRARRLALSLADLGEEAGSIERQLRPWHFPPAVAHECALWASSARAARRAAPTRAFDDSPVPEPAATA